MVDYRWRTDEWISIRYAWNAMLKISLSPLRNLSEALHSGFIRKHLRTINSEYKHSINLFGFPIIPIQFKLISI